MAKLDKKSSSDKMVEYQQFSTFTVHGRLYGIDVLQVQEVMKPMPITLVPHAPDYVIGLINLRGQVATAVGIMELFGLSEKSYPEMMNIVCNIEGQLMALQVDEIGDVIEVASTQFEPPPSTLPNHIRRFLGGVYKTNDGLLSVIDLTKAMEFLGIKKAS